MLEIAVPLGGKGGGFDRGVATCLGFDERPHGFLVFYSKCRGPLAAICFHHGPRKTMQWVQGLSCIVLSWSAMQQAGWSGQKSLEEGGPWTLQAALTEEDPAGFEGALCSQLTALKLAQWILNIHNLQHNDKQILPFKEHSVGKWRDIEQ